MDIRKIKYKLYKLLGYERNSWVPDATKGKYCSINNRRVLGVVEIDLKDDSGRFLRVIPYMPNHGFMVELRKEGNLEKRTVLDKNKILDLFSSESNSTPTEG